MRTVGKTNLYCFSPPVMLATLVVELSLAVYVLWRYQFTRITRLAVAMLMLLAAFQLAEYMVCGGWGVTGDMWARFGYAAITLLPPLGIHFVYALAGRSNKPVTGVAYAASVGFAGYFLFATDVFAGSQCVGNYVIFQLGSAASHLYTVYYYGLLLYAVWTALRLRRRVVPKRQRALAAFAVGYMLFMVPTTIVNTIDPTTIAGIPSIMCGFAVLLALVLVFWVLPHAAESRVAAKTHRRRSV